jgi:hypothetical protein
MLPFFFGAAITSQSRGLRESSANSAMAGLVYSIPMLFEIRFSPQLHFWIYGYYSHDFIQSMRDGSYRPVVFMGHGLLTTFFLMTTCVATAALWRTRTRIFKLSPAAITVYLYALLILCRSAGNIIYGTCHSALQSGSASVFHISSTQLRVNFSREPVNESVAECSL